jgi:uncharacterized protein (DUF1697 family)
MPTHAAFLRAVNLGSARKAGGEQLRSAFEGAGFGEVATFRNSGNVVFAARGGGGVGSLRERIEEGLADELGFEVPAFVRTAAQMRSIAAQRPFSAKAISASKGKLQVALLAAKPKAKARDEVLALAGDEDRLAIEGSELYWLPSGGTQQSGLDMKAIDRALGPNTLRTMGTIEQLVSKLFADPSIRG